MLKAEILYHAHRGELRAIQKLQNDVHMSLYRVVIVFLDFAQGD